MSEIILDSSVLIAIFNSERYASATLSVLEGAVMSTVNVAEVWTKVQDLGLRYAPHVDQLFQLLDRTEPFTLEQARTAADLRVYTKSAGLSLGDRACLALALELKAEVYTADRAWATLDIGCKINLIR